MQIRPRNKYEIVWLSIVAAVLLVVLVIVLIHGFK